MMFQPRDKMDGPPGAGNPPEYAYGWEIENWTLGGAKQNVRVIGHGGGINGFNTMITRLPADHRLIVILSNANSGNFGRCIEERGRHSLRRSGQTSEGFDRRGALRHPEGTRHHSGRDAVSRSEVESRARLRF